MIAGTGLSPAVWGEPRGFQEFDLLQTVQLAEPVTAVLAAVLSECAGAVRRKSLLVEIAPVTCCNVPSWGFMRDTPLFRTVSHCFRTISSVVVDLVSLAVLAAHSRSALAAENFFLRKQLALFQERKAKSRRADDSTRWMMATLRRMFQSRDSPPDSAGQ